MNLKFEFKEAVHMAYRHDASSCVSFIHSMIQNEAYVEVERILISIFFFKDLGYFVSQESSYFSHNQCQFLQLKYAPFQRY